MNVDPEPQCIYAFILGEDESAEEDQEEGGENSTMEEDDDEERTPKQPVKVRFGKTPKKRSSGYGTRSSSTSLNHDKEDYSDEEESGRGSKRKSASQAALKIAQVSKRLRSDSKENESSENSNDSNSTSSSSIGGRKRSLDSDGGYEGPKRTRLQRMNTNRCGDSGDLDNVLLDRLLVDLMKQADAWPFLKPVTRSQVSPPILDSFLVKMRTPLTT